MVCDCNNIVKFIKTLLVIWRNWYRFRKCNKIKSKITTYYVEFTKAITFLFLIILFNIQEIKMSTKNKFNVLRQF